jgi:hypothetical protein
MTARTLKAVNPDFSYHVGFAVDKPAPVRRAHWDRSASMMAELEGYFCIRRYLGKDFHSFA